jgi:hypothetical protein
MRRLLWGLVALASLAAPAVAEAADLVVPLGASISLSGDHTYGRVLVDGTVNITAATVLRAGQVNVGPYGAIRPSCTPCTAAAAPNITIISGGPVVIVPGLGFAGLSGGAVTVLGKSLALGSVITTGSAGPSGPVSLRASGGDLRTSLVLAPGTGAGLTASGDVVTGDVTAKAVGLVAGGDVLARGTVSTAPAVGGSITVRGRDLRIGSVLASAPLAGGPGGSVRLTAARDVVLAGAVSSVGAGTGPGGSIVVVAGRNLGGGSILATGGPGAAGGAIAVAAKGAVELGQLKADAGVGSPGAGGPGGSVRVSAAGPLVLDDSATADGGKGAGGAGGGHGGVVVISALTVTGGDVSAVGGTPTAAASVAGGAGGGVSVVGTLGVSVGGVFAQAQHGGGGPAAYNGANGGTITLSAPAGNLYARVAYAQGGDGGSAAPSHGGAGGRVWIVGHAVGGLYLVDARGGAGSLALGGVGGAGGQFRGFSDVTLFDSSRRVNIGSGTGDIKGTLGIAHSNLPPAQPDWQLGHRLEIISRSPDATGFRILRQLPGQARPIVVGTATHPTLVAVPRTRACVRAVYTVQALATPPGWVSSPSAALVETIVPSGQDCREAPLVRPFRSSISLGVRALRKSKGVARLSLRIRGVGTVGAILRAHGRRIGRVAPVATSGSTLRFRFTIPARFRHTGTLTLQLVAHAPIGKATVSTSVRIRIVA